MELNKMLYDLNRPQRWRGRPGTPVNAPKNAAVATTQVDFLLPATALENLGDAGFRRDHGLKFNYVGGAMANGIASVELVQELARAGFLGIYGAAGQDLPTVERAILRLKESLKDLPFGVNVIHSPNEPRLESRLVDLLLLHEVKLVEASAFLRLTPAVVRFRAKGLSRGAAGQIIATRRIIAKVSRVEVASAFLSPAPEALLAELVGKGDLTPLEAELARRVPIADDVTAEADSGGHTDNRPALTLIPTMLALRDRLQAQYQYAMPPRIGAAGGIATPEGAAAAFAMGAAYIVTGTVNQACVESGTSQLVRSMLAEAKQADCAMAPAADMFEMGVKVQVLKHGTMFPMRAAKLFELYAKHQSLEHLLDQDKEMLEKTWFRAPLTQVWQETRAYFEQRDPEQVTRAERDPRHKMALVFRSYLGQSSHWANRGVAERKFDFQIWCGPSMGAFNEWAKGSHLENVAERRAANVGFNLMLGAVVTLRRTLLRMQDGDLAAGLPPYRPLSDEDLSLCLGECVPLRTEAEERTNERH